MLSFFIFHLSLFTIHFSLFTLAKPVDYSLQLVKSVTRSRETFDFGTTKTSLSVDSKGFLENGVPVIPVMGEIHFSRVPESDWKREILKMKAGGINYISTYVFWNHHESDEGKWVASPTAQTARNHESNDGNTGKREPDQKGFQFG